MVQFCPADVFIFIVWLKRYPLPGTPEWSSGTDMNMKSNQSTVCQFDKGRGWSPHLAKLSECPSRTPCIPLVISPQWAGNTLCQGLVLPLGYCCCGGSSCRCLDKPRLETSFLYTDGIGEVTGPMSKTVIQLTVCNKKKTLLLFNSVTLLWTQWCSLEREKKQTSVFFKFANLLK